MEMKVKFLRADKDGWDYLKGPAEKIDVDPEISMSDLSKMINLNFGVPEGRSHIFYMMNSVRDTDHLYSDLPDENYSPDIHYQLSEEHTLTEALKGKKFKYEYSMSDGLVFQCEVL